MQGVRRGRLGGGDLWDQLKMGIAGEGGCSTCSIAELGERLHNLKSSNSHPVGFFTATGIGNS